jgi:hypothetical protein
LLRELWWQKKCIHVHYRCNFIINIFILYLVVSMVSGPMDSEGWLYVTWAMAESSPESKMWRKCWFLIDDGKQQLGWQRGGSSGKRNNVPISSFSTKVLRSNQKSVRFCSSELLSLSSIDFWAALFFDSTLCCWGLNQRLHALSLYYSSLSPDY